MMRAAVHWAAARSLTAGLFPVFWSGRALIVVGVVRSAAGTDPVRVHRSGACSSGVWYRSV